MSLDRALKRVSLLKSPVPELAPPSCFPAPVAPPPSVQPVEALLPFPNIDLSPEEAARVASFQEARLVLGAAAAAVMVCAPECPRTNQCPLAMNHRPAGHKCPLEIHYAKERFVRWAQEIGADPNEMGETERIAVAQLTSIDIQEQRCLDVVAIGEDAKLTQRSVKDCDTNGVPIAWETIIHQNVQLIEQLQNRRRQILRDWELTPEMRSKKTRGIIKAVGDLANKSTDNADKLRNVVKSRIKTIDVAPSI